MVTKPPSSRRRPKQQRSRFLVEAIVQACRQILEQEGVEQLTTQRIAEVAGVTIGSFYQYFPNKEAVVADVFKETIRAEAELIVQDTTKRIIAIMDDQFEQTIAELVHMIAALYSRYLKLHGDFFQQYHQFFDFQSVVDQCAVERFNQPSWDNWLCYFLGQHRNKLAVDNIPRAAFITAKVINGLIEAAVENDPSLLQDEGYLKDIERTVLGFLCNPVEPE